MLNLLNILRYNNIYTSNGVSLHELSVSLSKHKMISLGETDDLCSMCSDSGDLIVCDFCPRAFHKGSLSLAPPTPLHTRTHKLTLAVPCERTSFVIMSIKKMFLIMEVNFLMQVLDKIHFALTSRFQFP